MKGAWKKAAMDMADLANVYLEAVRREFRSQRSAAERALAQLDARNWTVHLDPQSNSVAVIVAHIGGNLRSRFTDFLTTDGEKAARDRDAEFEPKEGGDLAAVRAAWQSGWDALLAVVDALGPDDLTRTVTIRDEPLTVVAALERSVAHTAHHVGQIVFLAKHLQAGTWQTLSIPRGQSRTWRPPSLTDPPRA